MRRVLPSVAVACILLFANCISAQNTPILYCPNNIVESLSPGECETEVNFTVFASANGNPSQPQILQIDGTGYTSGDVFPIGTTILQFVANDTGFVFPYPADTCSFSIIINEYVPNTPAIVTDDDLNISIPATCEMFLLPEMVLEGNYGCYDDFVVDVENTGSNYIGYYYVGETIQYTITNTETGMMGWGNAFIEDKSGPYIQDCDSLTVSCLTDVRPVSEGGEIPDPTFTDCNDFTYDYVDMVTHGTCQDTFSSSIMRIWSALDELGYVSYCNQIVTVERTLLTDLSPVCPANTAIECIDGVDPDFSPEETGYPTVEIDSMTFEVTAGENSVCNITSQYSDMIINGCGASYKVIRTWTIMDWCLPLDFIDNPWTCTQLIEYTDTTPPVVSQLDDMIANGNLPGCRARPIIPSVDVDDCSDYTVFISTPAGPISGNGGQIPPPGLQIGTHDVNVKVTDGCGNATNIQFTIEVQDLTQPTPVCDAHTVVALDNTGYGFAYATTFDDGSTDNCCLDGFEVARATDSCNNPDNLVFGDYIEFCCADVGTTIGAILRVWDCAGNSNTCNVQIDVQDINGPTITCPPNATLLCGENYNDPNLVGEVVTDIADQGANDGLALDNCGANLVVQVSDVGQITCGSGTIQRTYSVTDPAGATNFCVQTITVLNNNPFTGGSIVFPADTTVFSCNASTDPSVTGEPSYPPSTGCFSLVSGQEPDIVLTAASACQKILRTWYVIDWCQYDANNPNSPGIWTHTQTINVMDTDGPTFPMCDNLTFCNFKDDCSDLAPDLSVSATDSCTDDSLITYSWTVDLYNDGLADPIGYAISGSGQNTTNNYPTGTHSITYAANDGCGNTGFCTFQFSIVDCKKPTPICNSGLIIEIMPAGMVPVNVSQLEEGSSFDNCTERADLLFSLSPNTADTQAIFECDDVGDNTVQVWVTDEAGNQDYCETTVTVQDNMNACGGSPLIAVTGAIENESNEGVQDVMVELNGNMNSMVYTNDFGLFNFDDVPLGYDYTLTPQLNEDPLNGVTTYDLYLLQRHILNIEPLGSPYKLIAADANNSGSVTVSDVVTIRKVILHIDDNFSNNTSWRFVEGNYSFPDPANPFAEPFPEVYNVNNLNTGSQIPDFKAVKIGDLNNTAVANANANIEDRTVKEGVIFQIMDRQFAEGEKVKVEFTADLASILGYQFTLGFDTDKLAIESLTPGMDMIETNFGMSHLEDGFITGSWFRVLESKMGDKALQFSIDFVAKQNGSLNEALRMGSMLTDAEAYEADGTTHPVVLAFGQHGGTLTTEVFELYQNIPNPFTNATMISFQLPEAADATLTIYDVAGKTVKSLNGRYEKGYHEISLDKEALPTKGIFYYRLETPKHTATKKMTML